MDTEEDQEVNANSLGVVLSGVQQERENWRMAMTEPDATSRELGESMAMNIDFVCKLHYTSGHIYELPIARRFKGGVGRSHHTWC